MLQFIQPSNQTGAVHIDNVAFGITNTIVLTGDYDASGVVDEADYTVWKNSFGSTPSSPPTATATASSTQPTMPFGATTMVRLSRRG